MNTSLIATIIAELSLPTGWLGILFVVAIAAVVIWAVIALVKWSGITIPRPVVIILIALACILAIIWMFKIFNALT